MLQTFCDGPNNGGLSLAKKIHEGPDPRTTLEGSTPDILVYFWLLQVNNLQIVHLTKTVLKVYFYVPSVCRLLLLPILQVTRNY